jgi:hypothetical protein
MMKQISAKDYIGWGIGVLAIIVAIILGTRNQQLEKDKQQISNSAHIIQQYVTNNNYNMPETIKIQFDNIARVSGDVLEVRNDSE